MMEYIYASIWLKPSPDSGNHTGEHVNTRPPFKRAFTAPLGHEYAFHTTGYDPGVNILSSTRKRPCQWFDTPTLWTQTAISTGSNLHAEDTRYSPESFFVDYIGAHIPHKSSPEMSPTSFPRGAHYTLPQDCYSENSTADAAKQYRVSNSTRETYGWSRAERNRHHEEPAEAFENLKEYNSLGDAHATFKGLPVTPSKRPPKPLSVDSSTDEELEKERFTKNFRPGSPGKCVSTPPSRASSQRTHRMQDRGHTSARTNAHLSRLSTVKSPLRSDRPKSWPFSPSRPTYPSADRQLPGTSRRSVDAFFKLFNCHHHRMSQGNWKRPSHEHGPSLVSNSSAPYWMKGDYPPPYQTAAQHAAAEAPRFYGRFPTTPWPVCRHCGRQRQSVSLQPSEADRPDAAFEKEILHRRWDELARAEARLEEGQAALRLEREMLQTQQDHLRRQRVKIDEESRSLKREQQQWRRDKEQQETMRSSRRTSIQHDCWWSQAFNKFDFLFAGLDESDGELPWARDERLHSNFHDPPVGAHACSRSHPAASFNGSRNSMPPSSHAEAKRQFDEYSKCWARLSHRDPAIPYPTAGQRADELLDRSRLGTSLDHSTWTDALVMESNTALFFLRAFGFRPQFVADGTGKVRLEARGGGTSDLESLKRHLRINRTRWHPDKLGGRNDRMAGRNTALAEDPRAKAVLQGINNLLELCDEKLVQRTGPSFL